jgi:DNA-binding XRE family transcriptional regulator
LPVKRSVEAFALDPADCRASRSGGLASRSELFPCVADDIATMSPIVGICPEGANMRIRTPADLGALIRDRRMIFQLDQKSLATKIGVSRQWGIELEEGKASHRNRTIAGHFDGFGNFPRRRKRTPQKPKDKGSSHGDEVFVEMDSIVSSVRRKRQ